MHLTTPPTGSGMKAVFVLCGSNPGRTPGFSDAARQIGSVLAASGIRVIFGGVRTGLGMGLLADAALQAGGQVIGVIPQFLVSESSAHDGLTELRIVQSMSERKKAMLSLCRMPSSYFLRVVSVPRMNSGKFWRRGSSVFIQSPAAS